MYGTIVVGANGTTTSKGAVAAAAGLAKAHDATVHVVWAFKPVAAMAMADAAAAAAMPTDAELFARVSEELDRIVAELGREGVKAEAHASPAAAPQAILDCAKEHDADLIVVGNKGMKGARRVLGSVPNTIAHHATCAVLIVPTC